MARKRRRRTKGIGSMTVICMVTVAVLNAVGISYGTWSDSVNINTFISTGKIEPYFCDEYEIEIVEDESNEELEVSLKEDNVMNIEEEVGNEPGKEIVDNFENENIENITDNITDKVRSKPKGELIVNFEDAYTMNIVGKVEPGYKAVLHYSVKNGGTLPVKYDEETNKEINKELQGLKLNLNQPSGIITPEDSSSNENGNPKLQIQVDNQVDRKVEEIYNFEIELLFNQWH